MIFPISHPTCWPQRYYETHRFTTWSDVFNIPSELRLQVTVKLYCPYMFFFSTIKTRNSTIHFSFLAPHRTSLVEVMLFPHAPKNLNYYDAYVSAWAWFLLYFVQERVSRVIPFRLSKTNQADHMCSSTLFLIRSIRIMLYYMIYPCGRCPFFTTPVLLWLCLYIRMLQ